MLVDSSSLSWDHTDRIHEKSRQELSSDSSEEERRNWVGELRGAMAVGGGTIGEEAEFEYEELTRRGLGTPVPPPQGFSASPQYGEGLDSFHASGLEKSAISEQDSVDEGDLRKKHLGMKKGINSQSLIGLNPKNQKLSLRKQKMVSPGEINIDFHRAGSHFSSMFDRYNTFNETPSSALDKSFGQIEDVPQEGLSQGSISKTPKVKKTIEFPVIHSQLGLSNKIPGVALQTSPGRAQLDTVTMPIANDQISEDTKRALIPKKVVESDSEYFGPDVRLGIGIQGFPVNDLRSRVSFSPSRYPGGTTSERRFPRNLALTIQSCAPSPLPSLQLNTDDMCIALKSHDPEVRDLLTAINLCHTASVTSQFFQPNMPEEKAIFRFCSNIGFCTNPTKPPTNLLKTKNLTRVLTRDIFGAEIFYNIIGIN